MSHPIATRLASVGAEKEESPVQAWDTELVGKALEKSLYVSVPAVP